MVEAKLLEKNAKKFRRVAAIYLSKQFALIFRHFNNYDKNEIFSTLILKKTRLQSIRNYSKSDFHGTRFLGNWIETISLKLVDEFLTVSRHVADF